jgi:periplasmic protein TonB
MSKLNINKNEWLELVFEGKNKEYGAYQLRQEEGKTTIKAFFSAMALLTGLGLIPVILSSFSEKPVAEKPTALEEIRVTNVHFPEKEKQKEIEKQIKKAEVIKEPKTKDLVNVTVVEAEKAPETTLTENKNLGQNTSENPLAANGSPTGSSDGNTIKPTEPTVETPKKPGIMTTGTVDKSPNFPGGINAFLNLVGRKFKTPEMEEETSRDIRVIVLFIVEPDGSLSNITVPKNPGFGLDKEAIRVLKSINTKWEPGFYKGEPVRTQYSLPIVVRLQ